MGFEKMNPVKKGLFKNDSEKMNPVKKGFLKMILKK